MTIRKFDTREEAKAFIEKYDLGIFGGDDFKVFHGALFDETGECCGTVEWTEQQLREYAVNMQ